MAGQKPGISFRMVHGRIIPIKITATKQGKKDAAEGASLVTAGVAVSAGAGKAYRSIVSESLRRSAMGWRAHDSVAKMLARPARQHSLMSAYLRISNAQVLAHKGRQFSAAGARLSRFAAPVRLGGIAVGSLLVGAGAAKLYNAFKPQKDKTRATAVGGSAAAGAFLAGAYGGAGLRTATKDLYTKAYPAIRALKTKWKL